MENAAAPMTSATLSFRDAMIRFADATDRIGVISASGDAIAGHIAAFGTQMTELLAAFDTLPEKIRATETGFGGEITRTASESTQAALRMSAGFERGQSALAMTLSPFKLKIEAIPAALAAASENTSEDIGARIRQTLDDAASVAARATSGGADILATRIDEISRALTTAADRLLLASALSGDSCEPARVRWLPAWPRASKSSRYGGEFRRAAVAHGGDFRQRGARTVGQARRCFVRARRA